MKREYLYIYIYIYKKYNIYILYCVKDGVPMLEVAARQANDNRETASDILEHVSELYKYSVHNEYVVWRREGTNICYSYCMFTPT